MAGSSKLRIAGGVAAITIGLLIVLGYLAYERVGPALGWKEPVVDTVPPELPAAFEDGKARPKILLFSKTSGFRHEEAIPAANASVNEIARRNGWQVFATENAAVFNDIQLAHFDVVFGNNITGDNWTDEQKQAFIRWMEGGGGFVGVHGAAGTRYRYWDWYTDDLLGGGRFVGHPTWPQFQEARIRIEDPKHPTMQGLPETLTHTDEWYSFEASPRVAGSHVLATLDEASYEPGDWAMGEDHPIIWIACPGEGRSFYSALGHTHETYGLRDHARMLENAIAWAANRRNACP
jgi:hypothetical protein